MSTATASVFASADDLASTPHNQRPAINPDFDPDESCDFDAYQDKCIPGSQQDCPRAEGFAQNEEATCHLVRDCPEGYHDVEDDESGQCYPNSEECPSDDMIKDDNGDCVEYRIDCDQNQNHPLCNGQERSDGIKVCDQPDHPGYKFC